MPYRDRRTPCPRCNRALEQLRLMTGHDALSCPGCEGVWTTPDAFRALATTLVPGSRPPPIRPRSDEEPALRCPSCGRPMDKVSVETTAVDWCRPHGAWFDFGELQKVLAAVATETERR